MSQELLSIFTLFDRVNEAIALYYNLSQHQVSGSLDRPVGDKRAIAEKVRMLRKEIYFTPFYKYASEFIALNIDNVIERTGNRETYEVLKNENVSLLEDICGDIYTVILDDLVDYFNNDNIEEVPLREEWEPFLTIWINRLEITLSIEEIFIFISE